jgi:hypothetical protein
MDFAVTEKKIMAKEKSWIPHPLKLVGYVGVISLYVVFTVLPAFSATATDEIAELKATIKALQRRVEALEAQQEKKETISSEIEKPTVSSEIEKLKDELALTVKKGDFPGSWKRPGSNMSFKIGGYVKLTFYKDFDFMPSGDFFIQTQIPVSGTPESKKDGETRFNARESRINLDIRGSTPFGRARAFIEGDFFGSGDSFRLRHAYGEGVHVLAGQTWSNFMDISAWPELLEIEGPDSSAFARQGQFRWTQTVRKDLTVAVALEDPNGDFTIDGVADSEEDSNSKWPDFTSHIRYEDSWGHLQWGGLVRQIRFDDGIGKKDDVIGWGTAVSGIISPFGQDNIQFQAAYGEGIGRYIQGLIGTGSDAAPDSSGGLKALPAGGFNAGYQHWWTDTLRSTVAGQYGFVDNSSGQPGTAVKNWQGGAINLVWNPLPRLLLGVEFGWGRNEVKDGRDGRAQRIQTSTQFNFD